jgi:hypothetical protein
MENTFVAQNVPTSHSPFKTIQTYGKYVLRVHHFKPHLSLLSYYVLLRAQTTQNHRLAGLAVSKIICVIVCQDKWRQFLLKLTPFYLDIESAQGVSCNKS